MKAGELVGELWGYTGDVYVEIDGQAYRINKVRFVVSQDGPRGDSQPVLAISVGGYAPTVQT